jgi:hypothetical protein
LSLCQREKLCSDRRLFYFCPEADWIKRVKALHTLPAPPAPLNAFGFHLTGVGRNYRTGATCLPRGIPRAIPLGLALPALLNQSIFNWGGITAVRWNPLRGFHRGTYFSGAECDIIKVTKDAARLFFA